MMKLIAYKKNRVFRFVSIIKHHLSWVFIRIIPKRLLSSIIGQLSHVPFPYWFLNLFLKWFVRKYSVNLDEMVLPLKSYLTFAVFFTRAICWQDRDNVDYSPDVITSPVDGRILSYGQVLNHSIVHVKGNDYFIHELMQDSEYYSNWVDAHYISLYLSPGDYHRVHMPMDGWLTKIEYHQANLFPCNQWGLSQVRRLFSVNERLISYFNTKFGMMSVIKVAALNVGKIKTDYFNAPPRKYFSRFKEIPVLKEIDDQKYFFGKLDEIAQFQLGSTVILFFQNGMCQFRDLAINQKLNVGQPIANIIQSVNH